MEPAGRRGTGARSGEGREPDSWARKGGMAEKMVLQVLIAHNKPNTTSSCDVVLALLYHSVPHSQQCIHLLNGLCALFWGKLLSPWYEEVHLPTSNVHE